jgi:replicative DNA helicase
VLGAILLSERTMYSLVIEEGLRAEDFYRERHELIYAAMLGLYERSEPIDALTTTDALRSAGTLERPAAPTPSRRSPAACRTSRTCATTRRSCARRRCCGAC